MFGYTTLREILSLTEFKKIAAGLDDLGAGIQSDSIITILSFEMSRKIQESFLYKPSRGIHKASPPFWYFGSDSCMRFGI